MQSKILLIILLPQRELPLSGLGLVFHPEAEALVLPCRTVRHFERLEVLALLGRDAKMVEVVLLFAAVFVRQETARQLDDAPSNSNKRFESEISKQCERF